MRHHTIGRYEGMRLIRAFIPAFAVVLATAACADTSDYDVAAAEAKQDVCLEEPRHAFCGTGSDAPATTSPTPTVAPPTTTTTVRRAYDYGLENSRLACGTFREAARRVANNTMDLEEFTAEVWDASSLAQDATSDGSGGLPVPGSEWLPLFDAFVDMNVALRNRDSEAMKAAFQRLSPLCDAVMAA